MGRRRAIQKTLGRLGMQASNREVVASLPEFGIDVTMAQVRQVALIPVFMPVSWMAATHRWLGLGEMPTGPMVEYLARSLSAFYALVGAFCLVMASDLVRHRPLARFLGAAFALMSLVLLGVALAAGMPWWWSASEGPGGVVFGALLFVLARPAYSKGGTA